MKDQKFKERLDKNINAIFGTFISNYLFVRIIQDMYSVILNPNQSLWNYFIWGVTIISLLYILYHSVILIHKYSRIAKIRKKERIFNNSPIGQAKNKIIFKRKKIEISENKIVSKKTETQKRIKAKEAHIRKNEASISTNLHTKKFINNLEKIIENDKNTVGSWGKYLHFLEEKHKILISIKNDLNTYLNVIAHQDDIGSIDDSIFELDDLLTEINFQLNYEYSDSWEYDIDIIQNSKCYSNGPSIELKEKLIENRLLINKI